MIEFNKRNARSWSIMGINPSVWSVGLAEVIKEKKDVAVCTADLARYSGLERIFNSFPEMCYNFGIAEQNMVGAAAGMAMEGTQVYMTTYAPFMTFRCADHVRHLMGNLGLNMKAIGSAAGLTAGLSGSSLLAISDIAFMRSIPNMIVLNPADCFEAVKMMVAMSENDSPTYMRFCGNVNTEDYDFEIGKAITLKKGKDLCIIASGTDMVYNSLKAAEMLEKEHGIVPTVVNMHTIKPLDKDTLGEIVSTHSIIVTVEEHNVIGGMGASVAEYISTLSTSVRQIFIGINDMNCQMGSRQFMLEQTGLTKEKIYERIVEIM